LKSRINNGARWLMPFTSASITFRGFERCDVATGRTDRFAPRCALTHRIVRVPSPWL
jgi:hypothetical protein